ncbi:MAG: NTP transferase domain-containing protein [Chitinophagaceae bacterium]|nr:NTP transferase domain-containing protein [Chitinophagaceae bacterium]
MNKDIHILSLPVQSGKTTLLQQWLTTQQDAAGFLSPDIDGIRYLVNIATGRQRRFQLQPGDEGIKIGRFVFDPLVFEWGKKILLESLKNETGWLIIDEAGRLEINQNKGWEPALTEVIQAFQSQEHNKKLLLVVRDYLLDEAIEKYRLQSAKVLPPLFFLNEKIPALNGLVLCGGESSRMGRSKAMIRYHDQPQFLHIAGQLQHFCNIVCISSNFTMEGAGAYMVIPDAAPFKNAGPISGVLSAIEKYPDESLMVVACDYPYLERRDLLQLFNSFSDEYEAVCFRQPGSQIREPLVAIYHHSCFEKMKAFFKDGGQSLRKFTGQINTQSIIPENELVLKSHDTPEDFLTFRKR